MLVCLRGVALNEFYKPKILHHFYSCVIKNHTVRVYRDWRHTFTHSKVEVSSELYPAAALFPGEGIWLLEAVVE